MIIAGFSQERQREHFLKVEDETTTVQCAFEIKATTTSRTTTTTTTTTIITTTSTRAKQ